MTNFSFASLAWRRSRRDALDESGLGLEVGLNERRFSADAVVADWRFAAGAAFACFGGARKSRFQSSACSGNPRRVRLGMGLAE
jgi:hypothetical protein